MKILVSPSLKSSLSTDSLRIILNVFAQSASIQNTLIIPISNGLSFQTNQGRLVNLYGVNVNVPMILHVVSDHEAYLETTVEDLMHD